MDQSIQWFPGHMTRTKRKITEMLPQADIVVEIVDARIPISSRNPDLDSLVVNKPRMLILNKSDVADEAATTGWLNYYHDHNIPAIAVDCKSGKGVNRFVPPMREVLKEKIRVWEEKGMVNRPIRAMVVGIPNSGKSSFINRMARGGKAKVEDRPGVTRNNQWFTVQGGALLLDTPGVLWPKFDDETVGEHLAFTGAVTDRIIDTELLGMRLLEILVPQYPELLEARYGITEFPEDSYDMLCALGKKRGMVIRGGEVDTLRAANMLLEEYRTCKIGKITLERISEDA